MYPCSAHIVTIVPHRSPLLLLLCPYIIIVMSTLIILWTLRLLYIERRFCHLNHPRIVHLCNVKEVAPSKRLNSKALIYIFYLFLSWFHNRDHHSPSGIKNYQREDTNQTLEADSPPLQTSIYGSLIPEIQRLEFCILWGSVVGFLLQHHSVGWSKLFMRWRRAPCWEMMLGQNNWL